MSKAMRRIRNIGIMAHIDAGKTTVSERLLFITGKAHKMGEVHEGEATMDWMVQERERGITITSAVTSFEWKDHELHLIDTPGHVDFTIEVARSLRVLDGAVAVFDAVAGVEPQSETVWRQADTWEVPRIGFVNKMDRVGADFARCLSMMVLRFGDKCVAAQLPLGIESAHRGVVDLVEETAWIWPDPADPKNFERVDVPADMLDAVAEARAELLEKVAIADNEFAMQYLEAPETMTVADIHAAIRRSVIANQLVPVLCGSALRNKGIQPLLDAITGWLPSPLEVPEIQGRTPDGEVATRPPDPKAPLSALAYKVSLMDDGRRMVFLRLYSGTLRAGDDVLNPTRGKKEKISRIFLMHAAQRTRLERVEAGNIFGVLGLKETRTGETLCDPAKPIILEPIDTYEPVISQSVEPETLRERDKLAESLTKLADEDPTFVWREDTSTGQTIISGMGELHLDILVDRLRREFGVQVRVGQPQVVYRETVMGSAVAREVFDRSADGDSVYGDVTVRAEALDRGAGNEVVWAWAGASATPAPAFFSGDVRKAIVDGIENQLRAGVLSGDQVQDVRVVVEDVGTREGVTKPIGYTIAASAAVRRAMKEASPARLAPIANVEVSVPPEFTGDVIGSINQRRGRIEHMEEVSPQLSALRASVPMARMFGYTTELRSLTQGRASFQMTFSHFDVA